jgi:hypothetical protein
MNTIALLTCIAVLLAVTIGLWLRAKLEDRRSYSA